MPTPAPATRTLPARPWPSAGPSTRAGMPGPVVSSTGPTPTPTGQTPAPSSSAPSTSIPPPGRPADRAGPVRYQNMREMADPGGPLNRHVAASIGGTIAAAGAQPAALHATAATGPAGPPAARSTQRFHRRLRAGLASARAVESVGGVARIPGRVDRIRL